jgi:aminopeptidase 2
VQSAMSGGPKKAVHFNTSPLMSTYLVAFIVGELNYVESNDFRVPVRVYAPPGHDINHGRFSVNLAAKTLAFYEKAFGIDLPLPKMDQVAVPDFAAGAMENWGLITYRVVDLMLDEKASGAATQQRVAEVVQHELAHQWFGNLVTMDWWEGLWLNEGFATWASWVSRVYLASRLADDKLTRCRSILATSFSLSGKCGRPMSSTTCKMQCHSTHCGVVIPSRCQ